MALFKDVKKPVIKTGPAGGGDISPLRPRYTTKTPNCAGHCPNGNDIRSLLVTIAQYKEYGRTPEQAFEIAWQKLVERNPLPAVCGRVCPHPCQENCNREKKDGAVEINAVERFLGDYAIEHGLKLTRVSEEKHPEKIAVVGSGPAGLSCAYQLARRGYQVTIFEAYPKAGGMLRYGIPRYRLPHDVLDAEIQRVVDLGVELKLNCFVGKDIPLEQLRKEYKAVFVGIGAQKGIKLRCPGEEVPNVYSGTEFLLHANKGEKVDIGNKVYVIGGGDTAIDAARVSKRLGADVTILYRRTRAEMPAIDSEIEGALEEGINIELLAAPVEILNKDGRAVGMRCIRMELGEPDKSGRPRPVPKPGSEYDVECTAVIAAISQEPDATGMDAIYTPKEWIKADDWGKTKVEGVYSGGDNVNLGLVTIAISQGRFAADAIEAYCQGKTLEPRVDPFKIITSEKVKLEWYPAMPPHKRTHVPVSERAADTEIERGLSETEVLEEAKRCMSCGMCMDCESCWTYCSYNCFERLPKGEHYRVKLELCNGCKKCAEACPCGFIDMN